MKKIKSTSRQYNNTTMMCINILPINLLHYSCEFGKETVMCLSIMKISECKDKQIKNKIKVYILHKEN